jgi:4a-hydroxytetrahydrobiopterin dehydratase
MTEALSDAEISSLLAGSPGWRHADGALCRSYRFAGFRQAIAFMSAAAAEIDRLDHHPEWSNVYATVSVRLTTHDAGEVVTARDAELARLLDRYATGAG